MHCYALITPIHTGSDSNPGWHFITAGIEHLVRQADPEAVFHEVNMLRPDPAWHVVAANCRAMFFCGNPRFNTTEEKVFWDWHIWERIRNRLDLGVPLIDAWAGSAHPLPIPAVGEMVNRMRAMAKTQAILAYEKHALLCIARDVTAYELLKTANPNTVLWPCSTWWAAEEMSPELAETASRALKSHNVISLRRVGEWQISFVRRWFKRLSDELPTIVLAHCYRDWAWFHQRLPELSVQCVTHPRTLLRVLAHTRKCISFRTHVSIPALSLGARVADVSIDSRSMTLAPFGVASDSLDIVCREEWRPIFADAHPPDQVPIVHALREKLLSIR